ncbi:MAG: sulfatase-like hydrolase/transferase [Bacteroidales bacterium]|nr:sulfatase-like hydrolase/transferase [Bacteroidales bacterium]
MRFRFPMVRRISLPLLVVFRMVVVMVLFSLSRWVFYIFNLNSFGYLSFAELMPLMIAGIRFDLAAVTMVNILYIILLSVPTPLKYHPLWQKTADQIFIWTNALAIGLNLIDTIYFRFIAKRTTSELFQFLGNPNENILPLLWQFLTDYWYMWVIWVLIIWVLVKSIRFFVPQSPSAIRTRTWYILQSMFFILAVAFIVIAGRGGLQLKPISLVTAGNYASTQQIPLVLNTPFSVLKTINQPALRYRHDFSEEVLNQIYTPIQKVEQPEWFQNEDVQANFVILILESFGQELINYYNPREASLTPFLDSLLSQSITFKGKANGKRSIEALPAILAGIPSLMQIDYPTSAYAANTIKGTGSILQQKGYHTAFFHGGNNGTMNFDATAKAAGFNHYFGRREYGNDKDFDGRWGIFDKPFLQFAVKQMDIFPKPFAAAVFTISSHHPFTLPDDFRLPEQNEFSAFENTVRYTDSALRSFFETAKQTNWFGQTIFIITADHTQSGSQSDFYRNEIGMYAIPIAFYSPMFDSIYSSERITQQTDIMPAMLALAEVNQPFVAFGNNPFDEQIDAWHISFINQVYQFQNNNYLLQYDGIQSVGFFDLQHDSMLQYNLIAERSNALMQQEQKLKAILQQYNNRMISNKLTAE